LDIRFATKEDNEKLLDIERRSAQEGKICVVGYKENFFDRLKYYSKGSILVAEEKGDIIGCIGIAFDEYLVDSVPRKAIYLFGLRTNPAYRMKIARWLKAIIQELENRYGESEFDFAYASVKADNTASKKILAHMGFSRLATLDFYACPVLHRIKNTGVCVERPDMDRVLGLYSGMSSRFDLVPKHVRVFEPMIEEKRLKLFTGEGASALVFDTSGESDFGIAKLSPGMRFFQVIGKYLLSPLARVYRNEGKAQIWDVLILDYRTPRAARRVSRRSTKKPGKEKVTLLNFARDSTLGSLKPAIGPLSFKIPFDIMIFEKKEIPKRAGP
jgi:RimJ/RimL family protein N-acetyltransferase